MVTAAQTVTGSLDRAQNITHRLTDLMQRYEKYKQTKKYSNNLTLSEFDVKTVPFLQFQSVSGRRHEAEQEPGPGES